VTPSEMRRLRLALNLTQAELAAKLCRSSRQVKRYEAGDALIDPLVEREVRRLAKRRGVE
jgi:transcriptional regulator with XRE-family HTH domain